MTALCPSLQCMSRLSTARVLMQACQKSQSHKCEDCVTVAKAGKPATKIWMVDMLCTEQAGFCNLKKPIAKGFISHAGDVTSPTFVRLTEQVGLLG